MKAYYVYILKCSDNSYYIGVTNDVERQFFEHQNGDDINSYTFSRRPLKLAWHECFNDINCAIEKEKQLKGWPRKKIEALINCHPKLVDCHFEPVEGFTNTLQTKKIVITGPESTGKSTLTRLLANHYQTTWVKEYAREYLEKLDKPYTLDDVLQMAKIQLKKEKEAHQKKPDILFLDTDLTVFKVWINEKYQQQIDWIEEEIKKSSDKIFFLCDIDIPWQPDPLREHPNLEDRQRLFNEYLAILKNNNFDYHIISGDVESRLKKCIEIVG